MGEGVVRVGLGVTCQLCTGRGGTEAFMVVVAVQVLVNTKIQLPYLIQVMVGPGGFVLSGVRVVRFL